MIVPFLGTLRANATLLKQIVRYVAADHLTLCIKVYLKPHLLLIKTAGDFDRNACVTSMNLPNRELLLLRVVFALPNASRMGLASRILASIGPAACIEWHRYLSKYLVDSVLPAPDSPDTIIDCDSLSTRISRMALSAKMCYHSI